MKIGTWAKLLLTAVPLLAGCDNFWKAPGGSGGGGTGASGGIFYVLNQQTNQIACYSIKSGVLTAVTGSPYTLAAAPYSIAIAPGGGFLYVGTAAGIYLYSIGSGGALTLANSSAAVSSDFATTMQVDSTGAWLVEAGPDLAELIAIPINSSTGIPTSTVEQNVQLPAATVQQLVISPDNTQVFVALGSGGTEAVSFSAGKSAPFGTAANTAVKNPSGSSISVAVDPGNRLLYIGETAAMSGSNSGGLRVFNYAKLTEISGSPYATGGLAPYAILPTPRSTSAGSYVYVANRTVSGSSTGNIAGFSFTSTGTVYSLTALSSTAATGTAPVGLAQDSTGKYVLVVDSGGNPDLEAYTFDATTSGKLDSALSSSTGTDPVQASAIAALP
jgi:6-phosphogluconolactonase (cycloisomerase 2 family)